jgi:protease-4
MTAVNYQQRRRGPGCLFTLILLIAGVTALLWFLPAPPENSMLATWFGGQAPDAGEDEFPSLNETWSEGSGSNKVVRIPLNGMILLGDSSGVFGPSGSSDMALRSIRRATHDPEVKAIIMEIDSGGGGITASDILYKALLDFKASDTQRRVVTICGDMAASGAYYIALASDRILAHPTTITGSIGVIIQTINFRELAQRHGIADVTFKSGENKDLLNPLGDLSTLEKEIVQSVVNDMHQRFVSLVATHRRIPEAELVPLTDGRIFTAKNAVDLHLIDGIGYWQDAVKQTAELLDVPDVIVYRYDESFSLFSLLRAASHLNPRSWFGDNTPRLQYRLSF